MFAEPPVADRVRLVPPGDALALAATLEELLAAPAYRTRLGHAASGLSRAMPGWSAFAQACLTVYRDLPRPR